MKKFILSVCLSSSFIYAQSVDYVPFSKISESKKKEYNFVKVKEEKNQKPKIDKQEVIKNSKKQKAVKKKTQKKQIKQKIEKTKVKKVTVKPSVIVENKTKTKYEPTSYSRAILLSASAEVAVFDTDYSSNTLNGSDTSISFTPTLELIDNKHKLKLQYFTASSEISGNDIDTRWLKIGYRYNYENANIGFDINKLTLSNSNAKDFLPSLELDLENRFNSFIVNYGASLGTNGDIDIYEYFLSLGYENKFESNNTSFNLGYKNKTIKADDIQLDYTGAFVSVKTTF